MDFRQVVLALHVIGCAVAQSAWAQSEECASYPLLRFQTVWSTDPACTVSPWSTEWFDAHFGGEIRQRYEYTRNPDLGASKQDRYGAWLQRWDGFADFRFGPHFRVFGELESAIVSGRAEQPSPVDRNKLDWQNAFVEYREPIGETGLALGLRGGIQEVQLGSARIVSVRDGPNVRRTFTGARATLSDPRWHVDALWLRPRISKRDVFDDVTDDGQTLWGLYATRTMGSTGIDFYYLAFSHDQASYDQGQANERRNTLGVRYFGHRSGWDWDWEAMWQSGRFGDGNLRAWTVASTTGYTWVETPLQPRVALSANIASGDRNPNDANLETFNPMYPRGSYFSEAALLGPQNFYNSHVFVTVVPAQRWTLTADYNAFWRLSRDDGVYQPNGALLRAADGSRTRFVATALSLTAEYAAGRHFTYTAIYTWFSPRGFLDEGSPSKNLGYLELTARYQF